MALDQSALLEVLDALKGAPRHGRDNAMGTASASCRVRPGYLELGIPKLRLTGGGAFG